MLRALRAALACALITLAVTGTARAGGGNYTFASGTPLQQAEVRNALEASAFPWSVVPQKIVIRIAPGLPTESTPGEIWLDANLVNTGIFSWGLIQHEYAHQVDFLMLGSATREALTTVLGGSVWCWGQGTQLDHSEYGCERFASTLAWSFWPTADNVLEPTGDDDESAALAPAAFKALLGALLKAQTDADRVVTIGQFVGRAPAVRSQAPATTPSSAPATTQARVVAAPAPAVAVPVAMAAARKQSQAAAKPGARRLATAPARPLRAA